MLAKNLSAPRAIRFHALSFTPIAIKDQASPSLLQGDR